MTRAARVEAKPAAGKPRVPRALVIAIAVGVNTAVFIAVAVYVLGREDVIEMPSDAMEPGIPRGARITLDRKAYAEHEPRVGDVVAFHPPYDETAMIVLRVVAVGPVEVDMLPDGMLIVDRETVHREAAGDQVWRERNGGSEYRIRQKKAAAPSDHPAGPWPVFDDMVFLLGDDRGHAFDSRAWGPVPRDRVVGRVLAVYEAGRDEPRPVE